MSETIRRRVNSTELICGVAEFRPKRTGISSCSLGSSIRRLDLASVLGRRRKEFDWPTRAEQVGRQANHRVRTDAVMSAEWIPHRSGRRRMSAVHSASGVRLKTGAYRVRPQRSFVCADAEAVPVLRTAATLCTCHSPADRCSSSPSPCSGWAVYSREPASPAPDPNTQASCTSHPAPLVRLQDGLATVYFRIGDAQAMCDCATSSPQERQWKTGAEV